LGAEDSFGIFWVSFWFRHALIRELVKSTGSFSFMGNKPNIGMIKQGKKYRVTSVTGSRSIMVDPIWQFHGMTGSRVRIAGLRPPEESQKQRAHEELTALLFGKDVRLVDKWYVKGKTLVAIIDLNDKPIHEYLPHRKSYLVEPSRRFHPAEQLDLVQIAGGLPPITNNPLNRIKDSPILPFLGEVHYPSKWWELEYNREKKMVDGLFCNGRTGARESREIRGKFKEFFNSPSRTALIIEGDAGVGKTWYCLHTLIHSRPTGSDYAYIDLRGRPRGQDLTQALHRELGQFLDHTINLNPAVDPYAALRHYLEPIVRPLFPNVNGPLDILNLAIREKMDVAFEMLANDPKLLADYNDVRLGYYDNSGRILFVFVDNIDNYPEDEQAVVFDYVKRCVLGHSCVRLLVSVRPSSRFIIGRLSASMESINVGFKMPSPDINELLQKRLSHNFAGETISLETRVPGSELTWSKLLENYLNSDTSSLLRDLCSTETDIPPNHFEFRNRVVRGSIDCRHYIRLFRRLLLSDVICDFADIASEYFAVHALLLKPGEHFSSDTAFLFNLFDNGKPESLGNALVRYRVLEYFHSQIDFRELFDEYFRCLLGFSHPTARKVAEGFIEAGLIAPKMDLIDGKELIHSCQITNAGRMHYATCRNTWYAICIKTGMYVEPQMILRGEAARKQAADVIGSERSKTLEFYATHGWVSDDAFIDFLARQEFLENWRINDYQRENPTLSQQIALLLEDLSSPSDILNEEYGTQKHFWQKTRDSRHE
jgi:hypothetical protein